MWMGEVAPFLVYSTLRKPSTLDWRTLLDKLSNAGLLVSS